MRVAVVLCCVGVLAGEASAQQQAQQHIVNTGINLGWLSGILETEEVTARPTNLGEITAGLGNAAAALEALEPLIPSPPYDRRPVARIALRIRRLLPRVGSLDRRALLREIRGLRSAMSGAMRVFLDARVNRLNTAYTCDAAIFDVGFHFGQGHTALQRGNVQLERRARQSLRRAIANGERARQRLMCPFAGAAYTGIAIMGTPSPVTYAQSLPQVQAATLAGGGSTPPPGPVPPGTPSVAPSATPSATPTPPVAPAPSGGRPDLSARCRWSSSYGVVYFEQGYYGVQNKTIQGQLVNENGTWVYRGRWGRANNPSRWGQVVLTFDSPTSFSGYYTRGNASQQAGRWTGTAECR